MRISKVLTTFLRDLHFAFDWSRFSWESVSSFELGQGIDAFDSGALRTRRKK
jgi:hypothetical protein